MTTDPMAAPVAAKPATTTKLTGLTWHNIDVLSGITGWSVTKTTAVYGGAPTAALATVQHHMDHVRAAEGGRAHGYKSLIAVRNKLKELGLDTTKDPKIGWSPCTLRKETATTYKSVLTELKNALIAYRHPEMTGGQAKKKNNNNAVAFACQCPRRIRVAKAVLELGEITCGVCDSTFEPDE
jgi:hypothetical protein